MATVPVVGDVVYYVSYAAPDGSHPAQNTAALVTKVNTPTDVSLCIIHTHGTCFKDHVLYAPAVPQKPGSWHGRTETA